MKKITKKNIINFWVDYIEVLWTSKSLENVYFKYSRNEDLYQKDTNFPWFLMKKTTKVMNYAYKVILQKNWYDCIAYHKWQKNWKIITYDFVAVYWVAFKVFEDISEIFEFLNKNLNINKIKRFDLAIDLECNVNDIYKKIFDKKKQQKWSIFFDNKWDKQTFYIWEKKKTLNSYKLFRCYNKIDDIIRNKRQELYTEYLKKWLVTRIELEFRSELTKDIELNDLLDRSYIFAIFLSYIHLYTNLFSNFKYEKIRLRRLIKKIDLNELRDDEILKDKYISIFLWYSRNVLFCWSCPVRILIQNKIISIQTIKDILNSINLEDFDINEYNKIIKERTNRKYRYNNLFLEDDESE